MARWAPWVGIVVCLGLLAWALGLLGCAGDNVGPSPNLEGTYRLIQVDGQALPVTVSDGAGGQVELTSGEIRLIGTEGGTGQVAWCEFDQSDPAPITARFWVTRWTAIDGSRAHLTYPDFSGAASPEDTVVVSGDQASYRSRSIAPGTWTLTRVGPQPDFHC